MVGETVNSLSASKWKNWMMKIALCSAGYGLFSDSVMIPMVNAISKEFSGSSEFLLNYVISGNAILALFSGLITGILLRYVRRKPLLICGTIVFAIGGIGGAFSPSLEFLAVMRSLDAISDGVLTVTTAVMIVELWESEKEQGFVFGLHSAFAGTFGCIVGIVAGYISVYSWRQAFYINAITFISVVLCVLFVPDTYPPKQMVKNEGKIEDWEKDLVWKPFSFIGTLFTMLVLGSLCYMIAMLLDVFIAEQGIGNSIVTGYMSIITAVVGVIGNMSAPLVLTCIKRKKNFVAAFSMIWVVSFLLFSVCHNMITLAIANALSMYANTWAGLYFTMYAARGIPRKQRSLCIAIVKNMSYINTAICTYIPMMMKGVLGELSLAQCCVVGAGIQLVFAVIYVLLGIFKKQKEYSYT